MTPTAFFDVLSNLPLLPIFLGLGLIHGLMGYAAMRVAVGKGYDRAKWLRWGLLIGTPSLIQALLLSPKSDSEV
jgi:H+/Cl- antiporter ClcA